MELTTAMIDWARRCPTPEGSDTRTKEIAFAWKFGLEPEAGAALLAEADAAAEYPCAFVGDAGETWIITGPGPENTHVNPDTLEEIGITDPAQIRWLED